MSRPIKFRAWDSNAGVMIPAPGLADLLMYGVGLGESSAVKINVGHTTRPIQLMQFTGLLDCNGVEIYEGDLVLERGSKFDHIYPVVWHNAGWGYELGKLFENGPKRFSPLHFNHQSLEVVGNIYESPELLGTQS